MQVLLRRAVPNQCVFVPIRMELESAPAVLALENWPAVRSRTENSKVVGFHRPSIAGRIDVLPNWTELGQIGLIGAVTLRDWGKSVGGSAPEPNTRQ